MKKVLGFFFSFIIVFHSFVTVFAESPQNMDAVIADTANYIYNTVKEPGVSAVGGEWCILGLARCEADIPKEYYENYYQKVEEYVKKCDGVLHDKKYTEYARVILALTSIGKDPTDVSGYHLLDPLGDYEKTIWQGINGAIFALIALDSGNYDVPKNTKAKVQATREKYVNYILEKQKPDGGWALSGEKVDIDVTAMALQALSRDKHDEKVKNAIEKGLLCLSKRQNEKGGFSNYGVENAESTAQVMVALSALDISCEDPRFIKNHNTLQEHLLGYYVKGNGFRHTKEESGTDLMATEQCFYAMVAVKRFSEKKTSLYDMSDVSLSSENEVQETVGLTGKNADVKKMDVVAMGKTFPDIANHKNKKAVEELASRNIINGKSENAFEPESTMTRAEFATIITRGLGLNRRGEQVFDDVTPGDWFYSYVNTAYAYGVIKGVSETEFDPHGTICREEAAVMVARAATLCGMETDVEVSQVRNILAEYFDYVKASDWAQSSLAFCYNQEILDNDVLEMKPKEAIKRAEIAQMIYQMLCLSKLI